MWSSLTNCAGGNCWRGLEFFRLTANESGGYLPCHLLCTRGTSIGNSAGSSPAIARATVRRQLAIVHRRWGVLVDDGACHLCIEFSKRLFRRQRTRAILALKDQRPGGKLVLALEIQSR